MNDADREQELNTLRTAVWECEQLHGPLLKTDYLLTGHKCRVVAVMPMQEGRDWWLGELTEPLPDWPQETHCLHLKTPLKEVVLGIYRGDTDLLAVICRIVSGYVPTERWMDTVEGVMRKRARERLQGESEATWRENGGTSDDAETQVTAEDADSTSESWSGRRDSNAGPLEPHSGAAAPFGKG